MTPADAPTDVAAVAGAHTPLRAGDGVWFARCPAHPDPAESLTLCPGRRLYYCYACGDCGGAERLARAFGVAPPGADPGDSAEARRARDVEARLLAACEAAAAFFEARLAAGGAGPEMARSEIERRGVDPATAARFRLGYAPAAWRDLAAALGELGVSPADAELAGLLIPGRDSYYDRFRHRIMFPVCDAGGRVIAFSGRSLPELDGAKGVAPADGAKYVNSPDTPVYRKGETVFGLHLALPAILRDRRADVVEGNFDVVAMHARGFDRAVAPLGTSFTPRQAATLRRVAHEAAFCFDGDAAGADATKKSYPVARGAGLDALVARMPPGHDPDSLLREAGPAAMRGALAGALDALSWLIDEEAAEGASSVPGRVAALRRLAPDIAAVADPVARESLCARAARALFFEAADVWGAVAAHPSPAAPRGQGRARQERRTASGLDFDGAPGEGLDARAFACAIAAAFAEPDLLLSADAELLSDLLPPPWRLFFTAAADQWTARRELDGAALLDLAPAAGRAWAARSLLPRASPPAEGELARALADSVRAAAMRSCARGERGVKARGARDLVSGMLARGESSFQEVLDARRTRAREAPSAAPPARDPPLPGHLLPLRARLFGGGR